jgi:signal transduction histidine kinase
VTVTGGPPASGASVLEGGSSSGSPDLQVEALVRAERVRALYERIGISQATVLFNSAVVALVLWGRAGASQLLIWLGVIWLVAGLRFALAVVYRRAGAPADRAAEWGRIFTAGAAANGLAWGAAPLLLLGDGLSLAHAIFLAFVLGGMTAGAALSNASHQPAFLAFAIPALLPMTGFLVMGGERLHVAMGVLLAVFGAAVSAISRSGGRALAEAVRLRFRNAELAERLAQAASELETRVVERTAQLEAALSRERNSERLLAQAARLASLGTLAAGVAHEVNNPLTYVRSNLVFLGEELARGDLAPEARAAMLDAVRDAADGAERVRAIVRQLSDLSRVELRSGLEAVELHPTLDTCIDMAGPEIRVRAKVVRDYGAVPEVMAERSRLVQVFLNLLLNAAEAIPEGSPGAHTLRVSTRFDAETGEVIVEVADDGVGIPEALLDAIWAPFFTTKERGRRVGLGLSICKSVVAGLGGRIEVRSKEGQGTTFTVGLRAARRA